MSILDGMFGNGGQSETDALLDHWRQQQAGLGTTLKYLYEKIEALEKHNSALENQLKELKEKVDLLESAISC